MQIGNFNYGILSSTYFGYIRPSSGALDVELKHTCFLHRVFGWVVVLRAAVLVVCTVRMVSCDSPPIQKLSSENHMLELSI